MLVTFKIFWSLDFLIKKKKYEWISYQSISIGLNTEKKGNEMIYIG